MPDNRGFAAGDGEFVEVNTQTLMLLGLIARHLNCSIEEALERAIGDYVNARSVEV